MPERSPGEGELGAQSMRERLVTCQWVPFTVDIVFAFFANPHNLPTLMPAKMRTKVDAVQWIPAPPSPISAGSQWVAPNMAAGVGSEITVSFSPAPYVPMRLRWVARITDFVWHSHFCDEQIRGPFEHFSHRHGIQSEIQSGRVGTLLTDEIEYALPFGSIGQLWDAAVRRQLKQTIALRQEKLPRILDALVRQMT